MQLCERTERSKPTDSLEWSRSFIIFSISRLSLNASGIPVELLKSLTDEDMHAIAEQIADLLVQEPVEQIAEFVAGLVGADPRPVGSVIEGGIGGADVGVAVRVVAPEEVGVAWQIAVGRADLI